MDSLEQRAKDFISKASKVHSNKYDYSLVDYINATSKVTIVCGKHGEFKQSPKNHIALRQGCPKCARNQKLTTSDFIQRAKAIHSDKYDYTKSEYTKRSSKIIIICPIHGEFQQRAGDHLNGSGCRKCSLVSSATKQVLSTQEFIEKESIKKQSSISSYHKELYDFIKDNCQYTVINNYRGEDVGDYEIDIWIPEIKFGIEIHGVYFHSANDDKSDKRLFKYHKAKADFADALGYKLIQIYDNEDTDIWKSVILNNLKVNARIYARNTLSHKLQNSKVEKKFFESNHISGYRSSTVAYGLSEENKLLACMSFIKIKNVWHIQRFATLRGFSIVGGASKLFAMFLKEYQPKDIITFANRRHGNGDVYSMLGFKNVGCTKPNYQYVNPSKNVTMTRHQCQKHKLSKLLDVFDSKLTESQNMFMNGYRRLWDAGNIKYIWCKHEKNSN